MKKKILFILTAIIILSLTGCGSETTANDEPLEMSSDFDGAVKSYKFNGCVYEVPKSWEEDNSTETTRYYYFDDGMLMVIFANGDFDVSDVDQQDGYIDGARTAYDEFELLESKDTTNLNGVWAFYYKADILTTNDKEFLTESIVFNTQNGIIEILLGIEKNSKKDYSEDFSQLYESVMLVPDPTETPEITQEPTDTPSPTPEPTETSTPTPEPTDTPSPEPTAQPFEADVSAGYYTVGIHIPAGKYDLNAISGRGNVYCPLKVNEIMGVTDDRCIPTFSNVPLEFGDILELSGEIVLNISCADADFSEMKPLENPSTTFYDLGNGYFTCGSEIEPGIYNISVVEGRGNVYCSMKINEVMGNEDDCVRLINNVEFEEGDVLELSGVTVHLEPCS